MKRTRHAPQPSDEPEVGPRYGRRLKLVVIALLIIAFGAGLSLLWKQRAGAPELSGAKVAKIGNHNIALEISDTPEKRKQGLSGRQLLSRNEGMLFVFDISERQCIWMKDMNINLDIIWADADKNVTHIETDVSPKTYPRTFCGGITPSKYVIELNSGTAAELGLKPGDKIQF